MAEEQHQQQQAFTNKEMRAAQHLAQIVIQHVKLNVAPQFGVSVPMMAAGIIAAELGWPAESLDGCEQIAKEAYRGHHEGKAKKAKG